MSVEVEDLDSRIRFYDERVRWLGNIPLPDRQRQLVRARLHNRTLEQRLPELNRQRWRAPRLASAPPTEHPAVHTGVEEHDAGRHRVDRHLALHDEILRRGSASRRGW